MNFTDKSIKALKAKDKRYVLTESGNYGEGRLQIRVSESGAKTFRVQYHINGKRKVIGLGICCPGMAFCCCPYIGGCDAAGD